MESSWEAKPGDEIVPGCRVVDRAGGGARCEVYIADDERRLATVAVKVLRPHRVGDPVAREALANEAAALGDLAHPVIVRLLEAATTGERPHLLLEYVEGPTLRALLKQDGPLAPHLLAPLGAHLAGALHFMHASGWVHLDVKPANVLMSVTPRLVDFSIARRLDHARALGRDEQLGTYAYMAPEQVEPGGRGVVGPPADVWGLGVTLYMALSASRPFSRADANTFPQLQDEPRALPRRMPADLADVVMRCLSKAPDMRPSLREIVDACADVAAERRAQRRRARR